MKTVSGLVAQGWSQGAMARAADGSAVRPESREAVAWCPLGAAAVVYKNDPVGYETWWFAIIKSLKTSIIGWADDPKQTHQAVVTLLREVERQLSAM